MSILKFDQTIQWWTPPEVIERWLSRLDDLERAHAGDEEALQYIRMERRRVQAAQAHASRITESDSGRLVMDEELTSET